MMTYSAIAGSCPKTPHLGKRRLRSATTRLQQALAFFGEVLAAFVP